MARAGYCLRSVLGKLPLILMFAVAPRTAARFSSRFVGGRCRPLALQPPLFAARSSTNPATVSPLFGRPFTNDSYKKPLVVVKESSTENDQNVTGVDTCKDDDNQNVTLDTNADDKNTTGDSKDQKHSLHGALHQVEHRATEKGGIELSRLAAEEAMKIVERSAQRTRAAARGLERSAERVGYV